MGLVYADLILRNAGDVTNVNRGYIKEPEIRQTAVKAMVDSGAATLVINDAVRRELGLTLESTYTAELADGSVETYDVTESVQIQWKNRVSVCRPILVPQANDVLLGAIPLEEMDLIINPSNQELTGAHGDTIVYKLK
jgi:clan AA aspartic protease